MAAERKICFVKHTHKNVLNRVLMDSQGGKYSRSQNLRHNVINQVIDDMARVISLPHFHRKVRWRKCTTSAHYSASYSQPLTRMRRLNAGGNDYVIARKPDHDDGFACTTLQ